MYSLDYRLAAVKIYYFLGSMRQASKVVGVGGYCDDDSQTLSVKVNGELPRTVYAASGTTSRTLFRGVRPELCDL
jgi:hypothetical protein